MTKIGHYVSVQDYSRCSRQILMTLGILLDILLR